MLEQARNYLASKLNTEKAPIGQPTGQVDPLDQTGGFAMLNQQQPPKTGTKELLEIYSKNPKVRSIVNKIATNVAKANWRVFVQKDSNGRAIRNKSLQGMEFDDRHKAIEDLVADDQVQELVNHPILDVLTQGNDELVGFTNTQVIQTHLDLIGEGFWLKERNGAGVPVELWPIPPHWIKDLPTKDDPFYRISAIGFNSTEAKVPVTEIIFFKDPDPHNPYSRGSGLGKSMGDEIEIDEFSAKHVRSFFFNRARPDIIISGQGLSRENTRRLEEQWLQKHQGFWNTFKPLFLSRQVDIKTLSQNFEQMQMVELRKHEMEIFINSFQIPPELVGKISNSNKSTITAADFFFNKYLIKTRLEMLRTHLQKRLVPDFDNRLILHYDSPVKEDEEMELRVIENLPWAFSMNEVRRKANMKPKEGNEGEMHLIPVSSGQLMDISENTDPDNDEDTKNIFIENEIEDRVRKRLPEAVERTRERLREAA